MFRTLVSLALAVAFAAVALQASAREVLTLERALALAEQHSPRLRVAIQQLEGARSGVVTAGQFPNPEVEALGGRQNARMTGAPEGSVQSYGIAQPLELPSVRAPRIRSAEAGREAAEQGATEARAALRAAVRQAYYDVLRRRGEHELAQEMQRVIDQIRRRIAAAVEVGEAPRYELVRADAEALSAANAANSARLRVTQAVAALRAVVAAPLPADIEVVGDFAPARALPPVEALREEMLARNASLAQARAAVRRAEARLESERALRTPQPVLRAGVEIEPDTNKFRVGVAIPLPVWNQRGGQVGEALAAFHEATAAAEARRLDLVTELENAYSRYQVASQQIAAYEGGLLKQAENALRVADAAYRFGERGFMEVLDAQRVLRTVRTELVAARFEQQAAMIEIERLRGADSERTGS